MPEIERFNYTYEDGIWAMDQKPEGKWVRYSDHQRIVKELEARISELERRLRTPFGKLPCAQCGGPHDFDTSVPSAVWNAVIRTGDLPDYLCTTCIVREFVRVRQSFTAQLWNEEFNGVNIEVVVEGQTANDAALIQEENNSLRNQLSMLNKRAMEVAKEVCGPSLSNAIKEVEKMRPMNGQFEHNRNVEPWKSVFDLYYEILERLRSMANAS